MPFYFDGHQHRIFQNDGQQLFANLVLTFVGILNPTTKILSTNNNCWVDSCWPSIDDLMVNNSWTTTSNIYQLMCCQLRQQIVWLLFGKGWPSLSTNIVVAKTINRLLFGFGLMPFGINWFCQPSTTNKGWNLMACHLASNSLAFGLDAIWVWSQMMACFWLSMMESHNHHQLPNDGMPFGFMPFADDGIPNHHQLWHAIDTCGPNGQPSNQPTNHHKWWPGIWFVSGAHPTNNVGFGSHAIPNYGMLLVWMKVPKLHPNIPNYRYRMPLVC